MNRCHEAFVFLAVLEITDVALDSVEHHVVSPTFQLGESVAGVGVRNAGAQCPADGECDREERFSQHLIAPMNKR